MEVSNQSKNQMLTLLLEPSFLKLKFKNGNFKRFAKYANSNGWIMDLSFLEFSLNHIYSLNLSHTLSYFLVSSHLDHTSFLVYPYQQ